MNKKIILGIVGNVLYVDPTTVDKSFNQNVELQKIRNQLNKPNLEIVMRPSSEWLTNEASASLMAHVHNKLSVPDIPQYPKSNRHQRRANNAKFIKMYRKMFK